VIVRGGVALALGFAMLVAGGAPAAAASHAGDPAPAIVLPTVRRVPFVLAALRGRPVYLNFFATWCGPCNEEAPSVARLGREAAARGVMVVGVDELEDRARGLAFARRYGLPFPIALDDDGDAAHAFDGVGLPLNVFIGRDGRISTYRLGAMSPAEISAALRKIEA